MNEIEKKLRKAIDYKNTNHPFALTNERADELTQAAKNILPIIESEAVGFNKWCRKYTIDDGAINVLYPRAPGGRKRKTTYELYVIYREEMDKLKG